jgi:hypothetical protein
MEGVLKEAGLRLIMHHMYANEVVHCRAISTAVLSTAYVAAQLSCSRPTYWDPTNHQISEIRYLYGPGRAKIQTKSLLSSTINIHITQRFVRCTDTENDIYYAIDDWSSEEAFLLGTRPPCTTSAPAETVRCGMPPPAHLPTLRDSTFASPIFWSQQITTSRFGSPD